MITELKNKLQKKRVDEFENLLKLAYSYIRDKKFESAVKLYNVLEKRFKSLPKYKKTKKLHQDILVLYKEISLYLGINEAYLLSQQGNFSKMKEELEKITSLSKEIKELPGVDALLEFTNKHYLFCLEVYTYNTTLKNYDFLYNEIKNELEHNDLEEAMKHYSQLLIVYNNLLKYEIYEKRMELYYKTKDLFRDLEINSLITKAYKKKKIEEPKLLRNDRRNMDFVPRKLPSKYDDSKESLIKIRECLANGNYSEVHKIYKKV